MSEELFEDKYLFTFQDETQLWIPRKFIEKYRQLSFYDIIQHSEKYDDGSYYIDIPSLSMNKVISFLMEDNVDIESLNLRDSYDIYKILYEYSVTINNEIQSDLLFHLKELFYNYLKDNNYDVPGYYCEDKKLHMPMELYNLEKKKICIQGLITPQQKEELFYYSLLIKMMNITTVEIEYDYSSNIPIEYICPSCIKDIFPSLEIIDIYANTHYKKTELLLNPNSDEYIMEYIRLLYKDESRISKRKKYEYYTESEMNEYTKISSLDLNKIYYSHDIIDSYNDKRQKNELPKLYKDIVKEAIYTSDYSNVEISETEDEYIFNDQVKIEYHDQTNDKTFIIDQVSTEHDNSTKYTSVIFMKLFEEGILDSSTVFDVFSFEAIMRDIDNDLFNKIMTTHIFPNVTELIYDDFYKSFQLSKINKQCFPKLHIINYNCTIKADNFDSLFPVNLISIIDTIRIHGIDSIPKEEVAILLDNLVYTHSIHIDIIDTYAFNSTRFENIKIFDYIENNKQNIDCLEIRFEDDNDDNNNNDLRNSLERFLKSNVLEHLSELTISFDDISIQYLKWMSNLFNNNKFNTIYELTINLCNEEYSSSEYLTDYENIMEKLIPKASMVTIEYCLMNFINQLILKGYFHNTIELYLHYDDEPDDDFCKLYTTDNFHQLKHIELYDYENIEWWFFFIRTFFKYINNNNFLSSTIFRLCESKNDYYGGYTYNPEYSIHRCKYDDNQCINIIIDTKEKIMNNYDMETLLDCINDNKTQNIRTLKIDNYNEEYLSKLINFVTNGKLPKLESLSFGIIRNTFDERISIYKQLLNDSSFIQENHVRFDFK
ncbi:hypothetical protein WA158_005889 [Blastocystis sp. Blastoise]